MLVPNACLFEIGGNQSLIGEAEPIHRVRMTLLGGQAIPAHGLIDVLGNAQSVVVDDAHVQLRVGNAGLGQGKQNTSAGGVVTALKKSMPDSSLP